MIKLFQLFLISTVVVSCSSSSSMSGASSGLDNVYISGGTEKFFLGSIPHWANFSSWAQCQRKEPIRYLNYSNIKKSYNLNYSNALHMQHMINRKISAFVKSTGSTQLPAKDETFIFNNVYAQVLGGSYDFTPPKFNKVSVIWIDPFLKNTRKIKKYLKRSDVLSGHPVLITNCLNSSEVEELIKKLGVEDLGVKVISSEMFSVYNSEMKKSLYFSINLKELLKNKKITLFGPRIPKQIEGIDKLKK